VSRLLRHYPAMTAGMNVRTTTALIALALLVALPFVAGDFYINLATQVLIAVVFSASLNILVGYAGLPSLGHAAFLGFAAYICAGTTVTLGLPPLEAALLALAGTTLLAAIFGAIALRASGLGFLMITLALAQVVWGLAYRWVGLTNGDNGITGLTRPHPFGLSLDGAGAFYWATLLVTGVALGFIATLIGSAYGVSLQGTRDQPRRMAALGHNVWLVRWAAFIIAGFWAGVAGLLYVYYQVYIHPSVLSMATSAEGLLGVIAGGSGTLAGPVVGAALVVLLKNYASIYIERWNMLLGAVFVMIVLVMPEGIVPGVRRLLTRRAR
jgi:branched-chain amino acid transport system permease protein